ncbi:hypothetical protein GCM10010518_15600 [Kitasatospora cinereorecta]
MLQATAITDRWGTNPLGRLSGLLAAYGIHSSQGRRVTHPEAKDFRSPHVIIVSECGYVP